jgi:hypothetical protein
MLPFFNEIQGKDVAQRIGKHAVVFIFDFLVDEKRIDSLFVKFFNISV